MDAEDAAAGCFSAEVTATSRLPVDDAADGGFTVEDAAAK